MLGKPPVRSAPGEEVLTLRPNARSSSPRPTCSGSRYFGKPAQDRPARSGVRWSTRPVITGWRSQSRGTLMPDRLEDLTGWVEYDVNGHLPDGDPLRCCRAWICDGIKYLALRGRHLPAPVQARVEPRGAQECPRHPEATRRRHDAPGPGRFRFWRRSGECRHHGEVDDDHFRAARRASRPNCSPCGASASIRDV